MMEKPVVSNIEYLPARIFPLFFLRLFSLALLGVLDVTEAVEPFLVLS